ncbi:receptor-type tyrosine-protein phosphatase kappa-like isoform X2 [Artemia franciscana]|uniref:receptor-type tyrosine-protein phosphatase kappa-like isoform X2 n=1 Tax=Artemia franciscana TaxID=6661 RepID=UPI0032DBD3A6
MNNINRPNSWSGSAMHGVNQNQYDQIPAEFRADRMSYDDLEVPSPSRYPFPLKSESDKSQEKQKKDKINQNYYDQIPAEFRAHRISHDDLEVPSPSRYSFPLKSESEKSPEKQKKEKIKKPRSISVTRLKGSAKKPRSYFGSASTSFGSIPTTIKLSMLNTGLLSFAEESGALAAIADKSVELKDFPKHYDQRKKFPVLLKAEFQTACKVEGHAFRHGSRPKNSVKNQNKKIVPYDYNRLVLDCTPAEIAAASTELDPDPDYINASWADSLLKPNAYIAAQGPNERTLIDFWKMIWQTKASGIVMLTKTFDFIRVMCIQYWPTDLKKSEKYGDIEVKMVFEDPLANYVVRKFKFKKGDEEREILQHHYTEWSCHSCPYSNAIMDFRRRVKASLKETSGNEYNSGPLIVHCSDGGGRTGIYLAIDANLDLAEEDGVFQIYRYLKKLRQARKGLIETLDQYKFVYDTLEEYVICGPSWFPVSQLSARLKEKSQKLPGMKINEYQKEHQQMCKQTPRFTIGDCAGGHRADNREKNRDVLVVPPDNFRPYLSSFQGNNFTDYINAVFVDGYSRPKEYIVTEWPLPHTTGDFWSMVYDFECSSVVVLTNPAPSPNSPSFWPESRKSVKYGPVFTIDHVSHNHYPNIKSWIFRINKKIVSLTELMAGVKAVPKTCQLFQLTCWPEGHKVPTSTNSLVELMNMVERWRQRSDYGPVVVVSMDGRSRCGVYCAANACIEQVVHHSEVDVFSAVKVVRRHRPHLVESMTEYKYCYDLVLHYVLHYLNKDIKK